MLYISSTCIKCDKITDTVEALARNGFKNIESSGGTKFYDGVEEDLLALKHQYELNYLVHNYFPPPSEDFILNLGSLDNEVYDKSITHYEKAIALSRELGATKFGLHAGFFIQVTLKDIGNPISRSHVFDRDKVIHRFCEGYRYLATKAKDVTLYVENNVLSMSNAKSFGTQKPFMLIDAQDYHDLKAMLDFELLLDIAHLNVSAHSLGHNIHEQLAQLLPTTDYLHLGENDGASDQSQCFVDEHGVLSLLKEYNVSSKTITCETYGKMEAVKASQSIVSRVLGFNHKN